MRSARPGVATDQHHVAWLRQERRICNLARVTAL
jgi:hypothetical protein